MVFGRSLVSPEFVDLSELTDHRLIRSDQSDNFISIQSPQQMSTTADCESTFKKRKFQKNQWRPIQVVFLASNLCRSNASLCVCINISENWHYLTSLCLMAPLTGNAPHTFLP